MFTPLRCCCGRRGFKNKGLIGISKEEISIFIQTTLRDEDIDNAIERIVDYRSHRNRLTGRVVKRRFYRSTLKDRVSELTAIYYQIDFKIR